MDINEPIQKRWFQSPLKVVMAVLGAVIGIGLIIFIGYLVYFLWQFKFGSGDAVKHLSEAYKNPARFSTVATQATTPLTHVDNSTEFIHAHNPTEGPKDAPITIIEFIDFECPFCREDYAAFNARILKYGDTLRIVFKHLPLSSLHPNAMKAAMAASCAQDQGKFWEYYHLLFERKQLDDASLTAFANELKLNVNQFTTCIETERHRKDIEEDMLDAVKAGVRGTPTYLVNGYAIEGVVSDAEWDQLILKLLK